MKINSVQTHSNSFRRNINNHTVVAVGSDHAGFNLKGKVVEHLKEEGYDVKDVGCYSTESCDYPVFAHDVAKKVSQDEADFGILVCGTGIGMSIAANRHKGIRAAVVGDPFSAQATRAHNNSNILCLGERVLQENAALDIVDTWLNTEFSGEEKHQRRIDLIG